MISFMDIVVHVASSLELFILTFAVLDVDAAMFLRNQNFSVRAADRFWALDIFSSTCKLCDQYTRVYYGALLYFDGMTDKTYFANGNDEV